MPLDIILWFYKYVSCLAVLSTVDKMQLYKKAILSIQIFQGCVCEYQSLPTPCRDPVLVPAHASSQQGPQVSLGWGVTPSSAS